jgi:hypothetical protein
MWDSGSFTSSRHGDERLATSFCRHTARTELWRTAERLGRPPSGPDAAKKKSCASGNRTISSSQQPTSLPWLSYPGSLINSSYILHGPSELPFERWLLSRKSAVLAYHLGEMTVSAKPRVLRRQMFIGRPQQATAKRSEVQRGSLKPGKAKALTAAYDKRGTWHYMTLRSRWSGCLKGPSLRAEP